MYQNRINYYLLFISIIIAVALLVAAIIRIQVNTDIVASLPNDNGVLADAVHIFKNHPIQNQIAIDIALDVVDKDLLVHVGETVEKQLQKSGLFAKVGIDDLQMVFPQLMNWIYSNLPVLFSTEELQSQVLPLITPQNIHTKLKLLQQNLFGFNTIGQAKLITGDPLEFRELKLKELLTLVPSSKAQFYRGKILSADARHLMILAQPIGSGTDTQLARKLTALIDHLGTVIRQSSTDLNGNRVTLTPVGAYRAALDNETFIRRDVNKAIILATLGIAALLLIGFPRPFVGLLALLPAIVGTIMALFVFSLAYKSISIMALGFGGAVISITVDHGIAYLLFLDRPKTTYGKEASKEVWAVGLLAALTSVGAFLVLSFCGFPIFEELGLFTAMGITFSFLFVHLIFPHIFPCMPPAGNTTPRPLQRWADRLAGFGPKGGWAALIIGISLMLWANPHFDSNLSAMNSMSQKTRSAESLFISVWGDVFNKTQMMTEADDLETLLKKGDQLGPIIEKAKAETQIESAFNLTQIYPSAERQVANKLAWKNFWNSQRVAGLKTDMASAAKQSGLNIEAFRPFFDQLEAPNITTPVSMDERYLALIGISKSKKDGTWRHITSVTPGPSYRGDQFYSRFSGLSRIFDARLFSDRMSRLLSSTFIRMLSIIGIAMIVLVFIFFANGYLTLICALPIIFAFICTLGTLSLLGHNLDIPALMLAIIVLGMGIDYTLFFVRSYQRYQTSQHPNFSLIRMSILMASISTLIGFGALGMAQHSILQSAGITSFLGIGYSLIGAFLILPPILDRYFRPPSIQNNHLSVIDRYKLLEPYPRFFARFKLQMDPLFLELADFLPKAPVAFQTILDIGSGYGVPACWLSKHFPSARIYGIEPNADRVRVANLALGGNGRVFRGMAPQIPHSLNSADAVLMLDMCHYLDDAALELTLDRLYRKMANGGYLYMRVVMVPPQPKPWTWRLENLKMRWQGRPAFYRSPQKIQDFIEKSQFKIIRNQYSGSRKELMWFVAKCEMPLS